MSKRISIVFIIKFKNYFKSNHRLNIDNKTCETTWDEIACWPQTPVNKTLEILCPNYIDRFNRKDKAIKHCYFNNNTSKSEWSITDYVNI
jgi:hypothetical protein